MPESLFLLLKMAGLLQIGLSTVSLVIPKLLNWNGELKRVSKLISQMFWTYAGYILAINLFFGIISFFGTNELLSGTFLAKAISFFIFLYWLARILIQLFYFDTSTAPKGLIYKIGEIGLMALFLFLTFVYGWLSFINFN
jgi:hypothetical protein